MNEKVKQLMSVSSQTHRAVGVFLSIMQRFVLCFNKFDAGQS